MALAISEVILEQCSANNPTLIIPRKNSTTLFNGCKITFLDYF